MSPDYSVIGRRIKERRLEQKLKQEELADKLNISVAFMSRVERGTSQINLKRLTQIAEILNVSPAYLLTGSNVASKDYLKEDFRKILEKCTPKQQKLIYQISELVSRTTLENEEDTIEIEGINTLR
ncbi:MAG: helix-turn-helix transcriptional regulator [Clostridia bacterium]|nr:helix-turn-helix transcriptional regulator [Clostridia bacterium]